MVDEIDSGQDALSDPRTPPSRFDARDSRGNEPARAIVWSVVARLVTQISQLASLVILARLLAPEEYGLAAIVVALTSFAFLFTELGLGAAVIHRRPLNEAHLSSAVALNVVACVSLATLWALLAPVVAAVFNQKELVELTRAAAWIFLVSVGVVPIAILERALEFRRLCAVEVAAAVVGAAYAIALAVSGAGAISLIYGSLAAVSCRTAGVWLMARWLPRSRPDGASARQLWQYSVHLIGFNVVNYWARNADNLLLGAFAGPAALGYYSRAYNLMLIPTQQVTQAVSRVVFPALLTAAAAEDPARLRANYLRAIHALMLIAAPATIGLAVAAPALVSVLLGSQWDPVVPILTALALSGPAQVVSGTVSVIFQAVGQTRLQFRLGLFNSTFAVIAILIGLSWGPVGVATSVTSAFWLLLPVSTRVAWPLVSLSTVAVLRRLAPILLSTLAMAVVVLTVGWAAVGHSDLTRLALQVLGGGCTYGLCLYILDRNVLNDLRRALNLA
jgi:O-antigen/teichoic acid export membrane protein